MQVTVSMVAGANHVVDLFLGNVGLLAVKTLLRPALVKLAVVLNHRVRQTRSIVVNRVMSLVVLDRIRRGWPIQGTPHAGKKVGFGDVLVASSADGRVYIAGALYGGGDSRPRLRDNLPARGEKGNAAQHDAPFPGVQQIPPVIICLWAGSLSGSQSEDKKPAPEQVSFWNHVEAYFAG